MSKNSSLIKTEQLGMSIGTASNQLRKLIIFNLIQQLNQDICFQCGEKIQSINELSIEHKVPYLHSKNPKELFFDLNNVAFSHLSCNCASARQTKIVKHPSEWSYRKGCRCEGCIQAKRDSVNKNDRKRRNKNVGVV